MENLLNNIIEAWSELTKDAENQTVIVGSWQDTLQRYNKKIEQLSSEYHLPIEITCIYIKNLFNWYAQKSSVSLYSLLRNEATLSTERQLFELFNDARFEEVEFRFYDQLSYVAAELIPAELIGNLDYSNIVENSLDIIYDELLKCRVDVYRKSGKVGQISHIYNSVCVFNTLVECTCILEHQPDGLYICYISNHGTSDGYFGFFVKSNGNLFSINERIPEAFVGQHQNGRNHRFIEDKPSGIFPYELLEFSNYDYKGYAKSFIIKHKDDGSDITFADLKTESILVLILCILMIKCRFEDKSIEEGVVYSNFAMSNNLRLLSDHNHEALMVIQPNSIVTSTQDALSKLIASITTASVLNGTFNDCFDGQKHPELTYSERGNFGNNLFVDLYGEGFRLDANRLLLDESIKRIGDSNAVINAEFVGNENEMKLQLWHQARKQLADHIYSQMDKEYKALMNGSSIHVWWDNYISQNIDRIRDWAIQKYVDAQANNALIERGWTRQGQRFAVSYITNDYYYGNRKDFYNNKPCNCCIIVRPTSWEGIEEIMGGNIPKIFKGFCKNKPYVGNSLLHVVDPVLEIQTPFERGGSFGYNADRFDFEVILHFSKSGLKKHIRDKGIKPTVNDTAEASSDTVTTTIVGLYT